MMPEVRDATRDGNTVTLRLFVPRTLEHFGGHFPGFPILPGVLQIDWAVRFAREHFGQLTESYGVDGFKCRAPVLPETELVLTLECDPGRLRFAYARFPYADAARTVSSGTVLFR
jgi:3-hydroxymyristoyl/3-hydroxydecanoyl-(acyl carrier protein) dehydratase